MAPRRPAVQQLQQQCRSRVSTTLSVGVRRVNACKCDKRTSSMTGWQTAAGTLDPTPPASQLQSCSRPSGGRYIAAINATGRPADARRRIASHQNSTTGLSVCLSFTLAELRPGPTPQSVYHTMAAATDNRRSSRSALNRPDAVIQPRD